MTQVQSDPQQRARLLAFFFQLGLIALRCCSCLPAANFDIVTLLISTRYANVMAVNVAVMVRIAHIHTSTRASISLKAWVLLSVLVESRTFRKPAARVSRDAGTLAG